MDKTLAGVEEEKKNKEGVYSEGGEQPQGPPQGPTQAGAMAQGPPQGRPMAYKGKMSKKDVENFIEKNKIKLNNDDFYLGAWYDKANNKTYLDVSTKKDTLRKSVKLGERTRQLEGFDVKNNTSYKVGNWDDFINSPEYANRLKYLNKEGTSYLAKSPTSDWWKLKGTELEEIYGTEN